MCGFRHRAMGRAPTPRYGASSDTDTEWGKSHLGAGSDTTLWIPSAGNPHLNAGSDVALWILGGENPVIEDPDTRKKVEANLR